MFVSSPGRHLQRVHAGNHFIRQLLEIKRRGYASVLSVAAPFDCVADADVLGAEDVVDVGSEDAWSDMEVRFGAVVVNCQLS